MGMQRNLSAVIAGRQNLIHDFHFIVMLAANRNIRLYGEILVAFLNCMCLKVSEKPPK